MSDSLAPFHLSGIPLQTTQLIDKVQTSTFQDNDDVPSALERFLQDNGARLFALDEQKRMLDMARKCTVTLTSEEAGLAWGAKIAVGEGSPAEERVFSYLVYLLLLNQQQRQMEDSPPTTPGNGLVSQHFAFPEADVYPVHSIYYLSICCVVSQEAGAAGLDPSAPNLAGGGDGECAGRASWAAGSVSTPSLDELLDQVKQCVIDGHGPEEEIEDSDDDDDSGNWVRIGDDDSGNWVRMFVAPEEVFY